MNQKNNTIKKRQLTGIVVSDKMQKTRVVKVERLKKHSRYEKYFKVTTRFKAHDKNNEYKAGDKVLIEESRPMSRDKRWNIIKLIESVKETKKELVEEPEESKE